MKRPFLILIAVVLSTMLNQVNSQTFSEPSGHWGIRASYNLTVPGKLTLSDDKKEDVYNAGSGFQVGVTRLVPIVSHFYVEPGAMLFFDTYSAKEDKVYLFHNGTSASFNKFGLRIPVMLGWHFDFGAKTKLYVFTGPEFEVGFTGKVKYGQPHKDISFDVYSKDGHLRNLSGLWGAGIGVSYDKYYLGFSGDFGFTNRYNGDPNRSFRENHFMVTIGMNLKTYHRTKKKSSQE